MCKKFFFFGRHCTTYRKLLVTYPEGDKVFLRIWPPVKFLMSQLTKRQQEAAANPKRRKSILKSSSSTPNSIVTGIENTFDERDLSPESYWRHTQERKKRETSDRALALLDDYLKGETTLRCSCEDNQVAPLQSLVQCGVCLNLLHTDCMSIFPRNSNSLSLVCPFCKRPKLRAKTVRDFDKRVVAKVRFKFEDTE